ncbi:MAG: DUF4249 domain-containing protein [Bacteroidales bacterium]|jgi:hypothetical protein|nr:DUF4249 domain-containing protein [Bacteroidales bacterium]
MKKLFSILSLILILLSCSREIEIDVPKPDPTLVAYSALEDNNAPFIRISKLLPVLEDADFGFVPDALVVLYENNQPVDTLQWLPEGIYISDFTTTIGHTYSFSASVVGFPTISASCNIPSMPAVTQCTLTDSAFLSIEGKYKARYQVVINDHPLETNYYEISLLKIVDDTTKYYLSPELLSDPVVNAEGLSQFEVYSVLASDQLFNGQSHTFSLYYGYQYGLDGAHMIVAEVRSLSESLYQFKKTLIKHEAYQEGADFIGYLQPVNQYTNIANGLGVFGAQSLLSDTLRIYP